MQWGGAAMLCDGVAEAAILDHFWLWVTAIVLCMSVRQAVANYFDQLTAEMPVVNKSIGTLSRLVASAAILLLCTALLVGATNNAFIYTRF
jgi:alginate O-acetyltransferase complex protein AlgI